MKLNQSMEKVNGRRKRKKWQKVLEAHKNIRWWGEVHKAIETENGRNHQDNLANFI